MPRVVDLELLRQATTDSIRVYEAIKRAQTMTAESEKILQMAEDLLRQAGFAYLLESTVTEPEQHNEARSAPERIVDAYVRIQQRYADLKDALYRLGIAHLELGKEQNKPEVGEDAQHIFAVLLKIEPDYRDVTALLVKAYISVAYAHFAKGNWEKGEVALEEMQTTFPGDKKVRLAFLKGLVDEVAFRANYGWPAASQALEILRQREPKVAKLVTFSTAQSFAAWGRFPVGPPKIPQATEVNSAAWEQYRQLSDRWFTDLDTFRLMLEQLKGDLASLVA